MALVGNNTNKGKKLHLSAAGMKLLAFAFISIGGLKLRCAKLKPDGDIYFF